MHLNQFVRAGRSVHVEVESMHHETSGRWRDRIELDWLADLQIRGESKVKVRQNKSTSTPRDDFQRIFCDEKIAFQKTMQYYVIWFYVRATIKNTIFVLKDDP